MGTACLLPHPTLTCHLFGSPYPPLCTLDSGPEPSPLVTTEPLVTERVPVLGSWEMCWRQSLRAISSRDSSADGHSVRAVCVRVVCESGV